ncbi:uncharacterized protein V6R79_025045 [Siganus canaliculatus]
MQGKHWLCRKLRLLLGINSDTDMAPFGQLVLTRERALAHGDEQRLLTAVHCAAARGTVDAEVKVTNGPFKTSAQIRNKQIPSDISLHRYGDDIRSTFPVFTLMCRCFTVLFTVELIWVWDI